MGERSSGWLPKPIFGSKYPPGNTANPAGVSPLQHRQPPVRTAKPQDSYNAMAATLAAQACRKAARRAAGCAGRRKRTGRARSRARPLAAAVGAQIAAMISA